MMLKGANLVDHILVELALFITIFWSDLLNYITVIFHSDKCISRLSLIRELIHEVEFLLLFV